VRILFLAHAYPRYAGDPVGSFVGNLAVALRDHDVQVTVSAPSAPGLVEYEEIDGIPIHRFRYAPTKHETLAYTGTMGAQVRETLSGKVAMASYLAAAYRAASLRVRSTPFDLVHAHWWFPAGLVSWAIRRRFRVPYLVTMHGSDLRLVSSFPMGESLYRRVATGAGAMSAVSSWLARSAESIAPSTRVSVAPMPVVARLFEPDGTHEANRLLFVGKLTEQKGLHRLLRAMTQMRASATLTVVGAGRVDDTEVKQLATQLGLDGRIEWLPLLTQEELALQYRRSAIHVVPALDEGLGLTAVESLLSETPVVGFASGGLPDIVLDGVTGSLVPPGDESALAVALDALLTDPEARRAMGAAGRAHALRLFGPDAAADRYVKLYRAVSASAR
jgi:glycosyltransferase involved in cell wall biosynthesis